MNPLTNMKNVKKLSEQQLYAGHKTSWHDQYRDSAWIFVGGLPFDLTEGDIICIFSQYGEIVNINLIRDKDSGKSKGFCFICYEDQRSTNLAVDNLNGIKVLKRTIRVDHVADYKVPKDGKKIDAVTKKLHEEGCAPKAMPVNLNRVTQEQDEYVRETLADQINSELRLPPRLPTDIKTIVKQEKRDDEIVVKEEKKDKKRSKKKKKKKKMKKKRCDSSSNAESNSGTILSESPENSQQSKDFGAKCHIKRKDENRIKKHGDPTEMTSDEDEGKLDIRNQSKAQYKRRHSNSDSRDKKRYRSRSRSRSTERITYRSGSGSNSPNKSKYKHHRSSRDSERQAVGDIDKSHRRKHNS